MKKTIFISYADLDRKKKDALRRKLDKSKLLAPIVIADRRQSMKVLADKVINGIIEADFLIPILTKKSFNNQWVNQEIGFAKAREIDKKIRIIPIIESSLLKSKRLKGFINDQLDLSYNYKSDTDASKERRNYRKCCEILIGDLELEISNSNKKLIKFKGSKKLYLLKDGKLLLFPDRYTRELFGFTYNDVIEYEETEKSNYTIGREIPSIKDVPFVQIDDTIYAQFDNELKGIRNPETYHYIKEINKNIPRKIVGLEGEFYFGEPLMDINKLEK